MSELLFKNMELTRSFFIKNVDAIEEGLVDVQPEGFNNTIHWHIGHVLTAAEQFMFGFPKNINHLPANYMELICNRDETSRLARRCSFCCSINKSVERPIKKNEGNSS